MKDLDKIKAAADVVKKSKIAVLLLPGVGIKEDLVTAVENGAKVARIATHVTEANISEQHIGLAASAASDRPHRSNSRYAHACRSGPA